MKYDFDLYKKVSWVFFPTKFEIIDVLLLQATYNISNNTKKLSKFKIRTWANQKP